MNSDWGIGTSDGLCAHLLFIQCNAVNAYTIPKSYIIYRIFLNFSLSVAIIRANENALEFAFYVYICVIKVPSED
jgi:hypothetical protein